LGTFLELLRFVIMTCKNISFLNSFFRTAFATLAITAAATSLSHAQVSELVVSTNSAEMVKSKVDFVGKDLRINSATLESAEVDTLAPATSNITDKYEDNDLPAFEIEGENSAKLTLGVLPSGTDTSDGRTRRDPFAIENIEVDPIYPEGIYVDELKATAGIGVSSEF